MLWELAPVMATILSFIPGMKVCVLLSTFHFHIQYAGGLSFRSRASRGLPTPPGTSSPTAQRSRWHQSRIIAHFPILRSTSSFIFHCAHTSRQRVHDRRRSRRLGLMLGHSPERNPFVFDREDL
jgi:hypothetical protein